jgi:dienelactone hydrolase
MRKFPRYLFLPLLFILVVGGFLFWGLTPLGPSPEALTSLLPSDVVSTNEGAFFEFTPRSAQPSTGLIIYPGGRVDWRSYAPLARSIAEEGYYVAIVPMPFSLAVLAPGSAAEVIASRPEIQIWAIGGHSLGGAMAANFAYQNPDAVQGLVLWAAYPAGSNNLSDRDVKVVSIFASLDGLATRDKIDASRALLPPDTRWVEISDGNHAQFGSYGLQPGDGQAEISPEEQLRQVAAATVALLKELEGKE